MSGFLESLGEKETDERRGTAPHAGRRGKRPIAYPRVPGYRQFGSGAGSLVERDVDHQVVRSCSRSRVNACASIQLKTRIQTRSRTRIRTHSFVERTEDAEGFHRCGRGDWPGLCLCLSLLVCVCAFLPVCLSKGWTRVRSATRAFGERAGGHRPAINAGRLPITTHPNLLSFAVLRSRLPLSRSLLLPSFLSLFLE